MRIWFNLALPAEARARLDAATAGHEIIVPAAVAASNLVAAGADPLLAEVDIAFGQPHAASAAASARLKWIHLTTAGYERYDTPEFRKAWAPRPITNSSGVYDEPCAQHAAAMILAQARDLRSCFANQAGPRGWPAAPIRARSALTLNQTLLIVGYGAIGRRVAELVMPWGLRAIAVRRKLAGNEAVPTFAMDQLPRLLREADHILNILPGGHATARLFDAALFAQSRRGAVFYNIGRGSTVDQPALLAALDSGQIAAAWLDVTDPEPLPPDHPLWKHERVNITPHTAGGHENEYTRLVDYFAANLRRHERQEPLAGRILT